jgi:vacuolar iron transporter family protein
MILNDYILKSIIYGGIDGIITMFNIVAGVTGAKLNPRYIFILGLAILISDGMSMGISDYLSLKADIKYKKKNDNLEKTIQKVNPINNGIITFSSFVIFGFIPIFIYFFMNRTNKSNNIMKIFISIILALYLLGIIQSKYTNEKWYLSGSKLAVFGGATSFVSYNISKLIMKII